MRSVKHCKQLLDAFKYIEQDKADFTSPKRGYGYKTKDLHAKDSGFLLANDYGHIPGLRGGPIERYPDVARNLVQPSAPPKPADPRSSFLRSLDETKSRMSPKNRNSPRNGNNSPRE